MNSGALRAAPNAEDLRSDRPTGLPSLPASNDGTSRWLIAFVLTAIFCAIQINQSLMVGSLALPPTYDAVTYYVDGATLLKKFHESGFGAALSDFFRYPPHSPLSTGLAFLGFSIFGTKNWVGPLASALVVFFFVRLFLEVARPLPLVQATLLAVALLGFPLVGHTVMDFRPDMICALLIAVGTLFIVVRSGWVASRRDQIVAGLIFAAALWAKPSIFPLTIFLFGSAMGLASLGALRRRDFKSPLTAFLLTSGTAFLLSSPYYVSELPTIIDYIWTNAFGVNASIWAKPMPLGEQLLFYLTGIYGRQSMGGWLYIGIAAGLLALILIWRSRDRDVLIRAMLVAIMVLIAYVAVTVPELKGPHGFPFAAIFLGAVALACITSVRELGAKLGWLVCAILICLSLWQFSWPFQASYNDRIVSPDYAESRWDMLRQTLRAIGNDVAGKTMFQTTSQTYLNHTVLSFEYLAEGRTPPTVEHAQVTNDLNEQRQKIAKADFVFAPTPDAKDVFAHLPTATSGFRAEIIRLTEETGQFAPPIRIPDPILGGAVLIYKRATH